MTATKGLTLALAVIGFPAVSLPAQAQTGLIVVAHGADAAWNARVTAVVELVDWPHGPVEVAFLMGHAADSAGWDAAVTHQIEGGAERLVIVPMLMSSFSGHYRQILYYAGVRDSMPQGLRRMLTPRLVPPPVPATVTSGLDAAPELGQALSARWAALDSTARTGPLMLVAHGPNADREARVWRENFERVAAALPREVQQAGIRIVQLRDDAPAAVRAAAVAAMRDTVRALAARSGDSVTVMPALISSGRITEVKIPEDLRDLPIRYRRTPLAPRPELARWIERIAGVELTRSATARPGAEAGRSPH